jgi:hypothetical protein
MSTRPTGAQDKFTLIAIAEHLHGLADYAIANQSVN